jgi:TonB family protein
MKVKVLLVFLLTGILVVVCPQRAQADKIEKQLRHAEEVFRKGDLESATREFEEILRVKPNNTKAKIFLGLTHLRLAQRAEQNGDRVRAIKELQEALRLQPDEAYWHSDLAKLLDEQGDAEGAAKECARAAELSPDDSGLASGCGLKSSSPPSEKGDEKRSSGSGPQASDAKTGSQLTAPIPTFKPDPPYSKKAQLIDLRGTALVWVLISSQGSVEQARVVKPLGLGLDQSALRTVRTWKFKPATRNGVPVPVRLLIDMGFRPY